MTRIRNKLRKLAQEDVREMKGLFNGDTVIIQEIKKEWANVIDKTYYTL